CEACCLGEGGGSQLGGEAGEIFLPGTTDSGEEDMGKPTPLQELLRQPGLADSPPSADEYGAASCAGAAAGTHGSQQVVQEAKFGMASHESVHGGITSMAASRCLLG